MQWVTLPVTNIIHWEVEGSFTRMTSKKKSAQTTPCNLASLVNETKLTVPASIYYQDILKTTLEQKLKSGRSEALHHNTQWSERGLVVRRDNSQDSTELGHKCAGISSAEPIFAPTWLAKSLEYSSVKKNIYREVIVRWGMWREKREEGTKQRGTVNFLHRSQHEHQDLLHECWYKDGDPSRASMKDMRRKSFG